MVIIKLWGGLGNQLFQYALYLSFVNKGVNCKLDKTTYETDMAHNGYELENIFSIKPVYCSSLEKSLTKAIAKSAYKIFNYPYDEKKWGYGYFKNEVANLKFGYLKGYWQTEKYFIQIEGEIRKQFVFPAITDEMNSVALKKIKQTNSISLHIRRGDYLLENRNWAMDTAYYNKAIAHINEQVESPFYFIFSDDINWAKENFRLANVEFIDWNKKENSYKDMQLMSNCKHNIIANSSFSWWGAWLNSNKEKIVIAPADWAGMQGTRDVLPASWLRL